MCWPRKVSKIRGYSWNSLIYSGSESIWMAWIIITFLIHTHKRIDALKDEMTAFEEVHESHFEWSSETCIRCNQNENDRDKRGSNGYNVKKHSIFPERMQEMANRFQSVHKRIQENETFEMNRKPKSKKNFKIQRIFSQKRKWLIRCSLEPLLVDHCDNG